jgi:hypothetical protein
VNSGERTSPGVLVGKPGRRFASVAAASRRNELSFFSQPKDEPVSTEVYFRACLASRSRVLAARRRALRDRCLISSVYSQCVMFECPRRITTSQSDAGIVAFIRDDNSEHRR